MQGYVLGQMCNFIGICNDLSSEILINFDACSFTISAKEGGLQFLRGLSLPLSPV